MADVITITLPGQVIRYDRSLLPKADPRLFDPDWLQSAGHLTGRSTGRNTAWFLRFANRDMVLRHYWRGGMIGKLVKDRYLRQTVGKSRAMREFDLLDWMQSQGLPVPRPVAARFAAAGLWYRADLLMERIPDSRTLAEHLSAEPLDATTWARIGSTISRMHKAGVQHSDLNCRNILLDADDRIWLIDFDKCDRRAPGTWTQQNLDRLHRSLAKEKAKVPALQWGSTEWDSLMRGYDGQARK